MKSKAYKIYWGVLMLIAAVALILYATGIGSNVLGLPLYKTLLTIVLIGWILYKIIFGADMHERFKIFTPLSLIAILLESEIASLAGLESDFINNWILFIAGILLDVAFGVIIPKKAREGHHNRLSSFTHYIDASNTKESTVTNKMGDSTVFFQNTELAEEYSRYELTLYNKMGNITVHVPADWCIDSRIFTQMGNTDIREGGSGTVTLVLKGENKMGNIDIVSP
ncbi:MAG: hypothetical protein E7595_04495 [Ruminococcaceae bacterium]|nr:hypothetical protein [Oscillospiraceae bacterium]